MNDRTDRPTPIERAGQPDCLVELALAWLQRPLGGLTEAERAQAINEVCLMIAQMRHRDPRDMDGERRRWIERVTVRLCTQCGGPTGSEGAVQLELDRRMATAMFTYHEWREKVAPKFDQPAARGPSDGGEVTA